MGTNNIIGDRNIEALLCNRLICGVRDYLKEYHINLTISQARQLRKSIGFDSFWIDIESAYEDIVGRLQDGERKAGRIDHFLEETGILQGAETTLSKYLQCDDRGSPYSLNAILSQYETLLEKKYLVKTEKASEKRIIDVFAGNVSDLKSVHSLINPDAYRQKQLYQAANGSYPGAFYSFQLTAEDLLLRSPRNDKLYHLRGTEIIDPRTGNPVKSFGGAALCDYISATDRIGLFKLRQHLPSAAYHKLEDLAEQYLQKEGQGLQEFLARDPERRSIESAEAILAFMNSRGLSYEVRADSDPGQIRLFCEGLNLDIRLLDLKNPAYTGKIFAGNIATRLQLDGERNEEKPYVFSPQSVVNMLRYRLGEEVSADTVRQKNAAGELIEHYVGKPGSALTVEGQDVRTRLPQGSARLSAAFTSTYMSGAVESIHRESGRAVLINSDASFFPVKLPTADESTESRLNRLQDAIALARENFKRSVFGDALDEYNQAEPSHLEAWNNFRRVGKADWERDPEGFLIDPATGQKVSVVGRDPATDREVHSVQTNDMLIYAYKESYETYLSYEDAALIGIVDGEIRKESIEEFNTRIREMEENRSLAEDEHIAALLEALGFNESYSREDKLSLIKRHFAAACDSLFGYRDGDGSFQLNYSNILKYSGMEERELVRLLQAVKGSGISINYVNENEEEQQFTYNRLKERTITFDEDSAKSLVKDM